MEDETALKTETNNFEIFVPGYDVSLYCNYVKPFSPIIDYDEHEAESPNSPISKLKEIIENRENYHNKILILWHWRDDTWIRPSQPERISAKELHQIIGHFVVRDLGKLVRFHESEESLLNKIINDL